MKGCYQSFPCTILDNHKKVSKNFYNNHVVSFDGFDSPASFVSLRTHSLSSDMDTLSIIVNAFTFS